MEKKFQVFVSSTYKDLVDERQEVMQALLEQDCIPVGMELFPATDDDQWTLIKRLIDDCDYYIVIVGGRYGSLSDNGLSYTQMEYEYALSIGIPIIGFLHENPGSLPSDRTDRDPALMNKLDGFKVLVQKKLCKFYKSPADLGGLVSRSLIRLIKDKPRPGWVKASQLPSEELTQELLDLRKQNEALKLEIENIKTQGPSGTENLSQGEDLFALKFSLANEWDYYGKEEFGRGEIPTTWNEIFKTIAPLMIDEEKENSLANALNKFIKRRIEELGLTTGSSLVAHAISKDCFLLVLVQLKALGLIKKSIKKRSLTDSATYWTLTSFGENLMTRLLAITR